MIRHKPIWVLCLLVLITGCTSCGGGASQDNSPALTPTAPQFNKTQAFADLVKQCDFGARIPGSQAHADCLAWMAQQLPGADEVIHQNFTTSTPFGGPYNFTNLIAVYGKAKPGNALLLCAHWDCRPKADEDPDPANRNKPVPGANDGASGTAVLLELAQLFHIQAPPYPVVLAFLDAEDSGKEGVTGYDYEGFCLGSEYLAKDWPANAPRPTQGILLDLVGDSNKPDPRLPPRFGGNNYLDFPIEPYSLEANATLVNSIWTIAEQLHHTAFIRSMGDRMVDDHLPFINAGIPTIDIIDFPFPEWHTIDDTPTYCSPDSLMQVGDTLAHYIYGSS